MPQIENNALRAFGIIEGPIKKQRIAFTLNALPRDILLQIFSFTNIFSKNRIPLQLVGKRFNLIICETNLKFNYIKDHSEKIKLALLNVLQGQLKDDMGIQGELTSDEEDEFDDRLSYSLPHFNRTYNKFILLISERMEYSISLRKIPTFSNNASDSAMCVSSINPTDLLNTRMEYEASLDNDLDIAEDEVFDPGIDALHQELFKVITDFLLNEDESAPMKRAAFFALNMDLMEFLPHEQRNSQAFISEVIDNWISYTDYDNEFFIDGVEKLDTPFKYASKLLQDNREYVESQLKKFGGFYKDISARLKKDRDLFLIGAATNGSILYYAPNFQLDLKAVLVCVRNQGKSLKHAPRLNDNDRVALAAVTQDPRAYEYVSDNKKDELAFFKVVIEIERNTKIFFKSCLYELASSRLKHLNEVIELTLSLNPSAYVFVPQVLRRDQFVINLWNEIKLRIGEAAAADIERKAYEKLSDEEKKTEQSLREMAEMAEMDQALDRIEQSMQIDLSEETKENFEDFVNNHLKDDYLGDSFLD